MGAATGSLPAQRGVRSGPDSGGASFSESTALRHNSIGSQSADSVSDVEYI